jgi:hypothetical protein
LVQAKASQAPTIPSWFHTWLVARCCVTKKDILVSDIIRTIGQARADFALTMMAVTYNIKRLVFLEAGPIRAVVCP